MKKIIFLRVLICAFSFCLLTAMLTPATMAGAQGTTNANADTDTDAPTSSTKPMLTPPRYVAMAFYKMTGQAPDFVSWAQQMQAYKDAGSVEQPSVQVREVQKMKEAYNLLMVSDALVVETQVTLSPYDATNQGFFVENFKTSTFFPASYNGQSYAIVPQGIMDKQWLKVTDSAVVASIEKVAAGSNRRLTMILQLTPKFADATAPATIDGESYWPIVVDVKNMMLYALDSDILLWQSFDDGGKDRDHQNILNLYQ